MRRIINVSSKNLKTSESLPQRFVFVYIKKAPTTVVVGARVKDPSLEAHHTGCLFPRLMTRLGAFVLSVFLAVFFNRWLFPPCHDREYLR